MQFVAKLFATPAQGAASSEPLGRHLCPGPGSEKLLRVGSLGQGRGAAGPGGDAGGHTE